MKQLISTYRPVFNAAQQQLNFSNFPNFNINNLYAVINVTQNTPIYIPGAPGYGISNFGTSVTTSGQTTYTLTLQYNTTSHSNADVLNVYYEAAPGVQYSNNPMEAGGNLEKIVSLMESTLIELKVHSYLFSSLLHGAVYAANAPDLEDLRASLRNPGNWEETYDTPN